MIRLLIISFVLLISLPSVAKDLRNCRPLFESLSTGILGHKSKVFLNDVAALETQLVGLEYKGVIPWVPKESNDLTRKLIRHHGLEHLADPIPTYDKTQKLGVKTVNIKDIRFSQVDCKNASDGGYTVINNAKAFKDGSLKPSDLPPLKVWQDVEGRIWSLDHRRLAAMRLSGTIQNAQVEFVAEEVVKADRFKFATKSEGQTIFVRLDPKPGKPPMAIVIMSDEYAAKGKHAGSFTRTNINATGPDVIQGLPILGDLNKLVPAATPKYSKVTTSLDGFLTAFAPEQRVKWLRARGNAHFDRLRQMSEDIASAYKELEVKEVGNLNTNYGRFGAFSGRGKSADSVMAKLLRKDFNAFMRGDEGITDLKQSLAAIGDGIGARLTFKAEKNGVVSPALIQNFVDQVVIDIKNGNNVTEIMNYRAVGTNGLPYLSDVQIGQIIKADEEYRKGLELLKAQGKEVTIPKPILIKSGPTATFPDGYTAFHMNIQYKSGVQAEFQVRGPMMNEAAEIKHLFYDINAGKVLSEKYKASAAISGAARDYKALAEADRARVMKYVEEKLIYARKLETGTPAVAPRLPADLPQNLSFENLGPEIFGAH